jgi:hypothetical protein
MPFSLTWPANYKEEIEINLPEEWNADQSFDKTETASFAMTARFSFDGRRAISLKYSYENMKDHVNATGTKEYMDGLDKRDNEFNYVLSYSVDGKPIPSSPEKDSKKNNNLYIGLLVLLVIGGIIWWFLRK